MHDQDTAPNISRGAYGDSITSLSLLAGVMTALFTRERTGIGQQVEVSLYNTAAWVLGFDITGCLVTGKDAPRPQRKSMANPIRNHYPHQGQPMDYAGNDQRADLLAGILQGNRPSGAAE
jgi:crotonobetainyl-CoA:carnitine CoA-transferase CaiB-like acyl-CoA transferase